MKKQLFAAIAFFASSTIIAQVANPNGTAGILTTTNPLTNNVGIGTTTPLNKLHIITGVMNDGLKIEQTTGHSAAIHLHNLTADGHKWSILSTGTGNSQGGKKLLFYNYYTNTTAFCLNGDAAVATQPLSRNYLGLNTVSPKTRLHIQDGSLKLTGTDPVHGAPNIFWGGNPASATDAPDGEWALEYMNGTTKGLNFWRPNSSHNGSGGLQSTVNNILFLSNYNNVGIGTAAPHSSSMLTVQGKVLIGNPATVTMPGNYGLYVENGLLTNIVKVATVNSSAWADYVFDPSYQLNSISYVEQYVKQHNHLPNVPSASDVEKNGIDMVSMDANLLRQVEELWLHVIELKKENESLRKELTDKN